MIKIMEHFDPSKPNALFDIHGTLILDKDYATHKFVINGAIVNEMLLQQELGKNLIIWTCGTDEEVGEALSILATLPEEIKIAKIDNETKMMLKHPESVLYDDKSINPLKWEVIPAEVALPFASKEVEEEVKVEEDKTPTATPIIDVTKDIKRIDKEIEEIKEKIGLEEKEEAGLDELI